MSTFVTFSRVLAAVCGIRREARAGGGDEVDESWGGGWFAGRGPAE